MLCTIVALLFSRTAAFQTVRQRARMSALAATAKPTTIVWLRDELRVHDNALLAEAAARGGPVLPVYVLDDRVFDAAAKSESGGSRKCGAKRARFTLEALDDLRTTLGARGSGLVVERGRPADVLAGLCAAVGGDATVLCSDAACSEERKDEAAVAEVAPLAKVWEGTLYHPEDLRGVAFHDLFTAWRTKVEKAGTRVRGDVFPATAKLPAPPAGVDAKLAAPLPTLDALGYDAADAACDGRGDFFMPAGGETAALARLRKYVFEEDRLKDYFDTRNGMIGQGYSTKLAPWLSRGCVSPRAVARACAEYERTRGIKNKSTYWVVFELTWRDYFVFYAQTYGSKLFRPYGVKDIRERTWRADTEALRRWKAGETGAPLVDANMRELSATGFMSNRGRQNVASYLVLDLGLDWRLGAEHFEEHLVDYTPEANWGNWHAAAGLSGGRVNRFNILKQSKDYDPKGDYVKLWIPELAKVPAPQCFTPSSLSKADREAAGADDYPAPLPTQGFKFPDGARPGKKSHQQDRKGKGGERAQIQRKRKQKSRVQASAWAE